MNGQFIDCKQKILDVLVKVSKKVVNLKLSSNLKIRSQNDFCPSAPGFPGLKLLLRIAELRQMRPPKTGARTLDLVTKVLIKETWGSPLNNQQI
jgi:hypothetical protein